MAEPIKDWIAEAAAELAFLVRDEEPKGQLSPPDAARIISKHCPFKPDVAYEPVKCDPLLQCIMCHRYASVLEARLRNFNTGLCANCGGAFRVCS